jgi:hypothetical protein
MKKSGCSFIVFIEAATSREITWGTENIDGNGKRRCT